MPLRLRLSCLRGWGRQDEVSARPRMSARDRPLVLAMSVHPTRVAATRLRVAQHVPYLNDAGLDVRLWSFFREDDLTAWYGRRQHARLLVLIRALLRLPLVLRALRDVRLVIVQREALPLGPPVVELLAARGRRLVWDLDDAVWEQFDSPTAGRVPQWVRATGDKYRRICRRADEVWAGSEVLARWCREHNQNVQVVPTVVPVPPRQRAAQQRTVAWIGSHSTGPFIEAVLPAVALVDPAPEILLVGAMLPSLSAVAAQVLPWSQQNEDETLAQARVGLYPVDRQHPLAEGKCGLKAILYMSHGIPSVITPTTTNALVVRDGVEGLYADTPAEWTAKVQRLLDDEDLWERMSEAAHQRARADFSLEVWGPRLAARLVRLTMEH